jgi:hypothetical protein
MYVATNNKECNKVCSRSVNNKGRTADDVEAKQVGFFTTAVSR